ncbi:cysteine proteinase [Penicillium lagena]|uniref:cysteine proteinase n=1 Tax=Penicillium lagena TaxID=94218 RepID=UPI0025418744|nr:cysteine proteinase [Penicillium lagena]KAJ5624538.1 cysteine proteinase [Penicillium lagena]
MSLSELPWSPIGPHHPFVDKQKVASLYRNSFFASQLSVPPFVAPPFVNMNPLSPEEMERFQKLSNEFEPDVQGPLVSTKQSSHAIAVEYANADPTLATKTGTLVVTHPMTRIMKGDGNCGWRAVAFGYFEMLFALRDLSRVQRELARIKSLNTLMDQVGQEEHLYEIFVDATEDIFAQISAAIQNGTPDESFLVDAFNEEYSSNSVITHFRLLTSAWMKLNPHRYQAFLPLPLDQYCATQVETVRTEIDEVGLQALVDGIIEGAGFGVEILYLDRSEGEAVTPHQLSPNRPNVATIRLLYRPGHYDLLYRAEPTVNMAPVVNYQYAMTSNYSPWEQGALSFDVNPHLMSIPNLMADPSYGMAPSPIMSPVSPASAQPTSPFRVSSPQDMFHSPVSSHAPVPSTIPISSPPPPMTSLPSRSSDGPQIRLNPLVMKPNLSRSLPITTPFKK